MWISKKYYQMLINNNNSAAINLNAERQRNLNLLKANRDWKHENMRLLEKLTDSVNLNERLLKIIESGNK